MMRQVRVHNLPSQQPRLKLPRGTFDLFHAEREDSRRLAVVIAAAAWLPTALLSVWTGSHSIQGFLMDFAAQSRLLVVIPLLIVTESWMIQRWTHISSHFLKADLIAKEDIPRFQAAFAAFNQRRHLLLAQVVIVGLVYSLVSAAIPYVRRGEFPEWCSGTTILGRLSLPGASYLLLSLPFLLYLVFRWLWNFALWGEFLTRVSRMHLRLISSHPDQTGGLGFLEASLRGYLPFAFAIGTIVAGGIANKIALAQVNLLMFKSTAVFVVAVVVLVCAGPLCSFYNALVKAKSHGTFLYGAFALGIGHQFEAKWLAQNKPSSQEMLEVPDFSATTDLYSVAANVRAMRYVPFGLQSITRLVVVTLAPAIPLALFIFPFDVLLDKVIKLLL